MLCPAGDRNMAGMDTASYRTALLATAVSPRFLESMGCAYGVQCWGWLSSQCHRALLHMSP